VYTSRLVLELWLGLVIAAYSVLLAIKFLACKLRDNVRAAYLI